METERQLIESIRRGEPSARRRLYERFAGVALATALRYVPRQDEALDIVQDAFVNILTSVSRFQHRSEGSLKAWVLTIVAHRAVDYIKQHERLLFTDHLPEQATEEEPDVGLIPPEVLNRLIGQLPTGYRTVLNLYVFQQLSHKEIARLLGIKPETSASQYLRAKQALARLIKNYQDNNKL